MELKEIKSAIVKRKTIVYNNLKGYCTGVTMRLCYKGNICTRSVSDYPAENADYFSWNYFVELHDLYANSIFSAPMEKCVLLEEVQQT